MRAHLTPLQRFSLLSRWRHQLRDDQPRDIEHMPTGWQDYDDHIETSDAANDARIPPEDVEPQPLRVLAIFFVVPTLLAIVAAAASLAARGCAA